MNVTQLVRLKVRDVRTHWLQSGSSRPLTRVLVQATSELRHAAAHVTAQGRLLRAARRGNGTPLHVHLGCGDDVRAGWLNVDFEPTAAARARAAQLDAQLVRYDLRRGLPLPTGSCALIYSSHFLEHLEFREGVALMRECHRALAAGGRFRAALPNLRRAFAAYLAGEASYFAGIDRSATAPYSESGMEALVDFINYSVYQYGEHRCIYDEEKIVRTLSAVGFSVVRIAKYDPELDASSDLRRRYSFYVEGVR